MEIEIDDLTRREHPVVVVGAGPAGLAAAVTLARHGVECLLVERRPAGSELPRATVLSLRTMEVLRSWGLEERIVAGGDDVEVALLETLTAAEAGSGTRFDVGYPTPQQSSVVSPATVACVPQDHLEAVLRDHVASLPSARIETGVEAIGVSAVPGGAEITLQEQSGERRTVAASHVVAADGARSRIRSSLQVIAGDRDGRSRRDLRRGAHGSGHLCGTWSVSTGTACTRSPHPAASGVLIPAGQGDRWLFGVVWDDTTDLVSELTTEDLRRRVQIASGVPDLPVEVERIGRFSAGAQLAERFSDGEVFLVGDAAHRVTPRGGIGLNLAFGDGVDLGWKLAWVRRGWASASLLDSCEAERRPPSAHNVARSADLFGSRREVITEMDVDLGGRVRHAWVDDQETAGTRRSTLDLLGEGLTLFVGLDAPTWPAAVDSLDVDVPVTAAPLEPLVARALGIGPAGALLVRPDGALLVRPDGVPVAGWSSSVDAEAHLADAVATFTWHLSTRAANPVTAA